MPPPPDEAAIRVDHLPYVERLDARAVDAVELVVIHCTELPDLAAAREYGERVLYPASGTGNSGHWYIDRDGGIVEYVPATRVAHHVRGHNPRSVGIELVNTGRWPRWLDADHQAMDEPYPDAQVEALLALLAKLRADLPALRPRGPRHRARARRRRSRHAGRAQARSRPAVPVGAGARSVGTAAASLACGCHSERGEESAFIDDLPDRKQIPRCARNDNFPSERQFFLGTTVFLGMTAFGSGGLSAGHIRNDPRHSASPPRRHGRRKHGAWPGALARGTYNPGICRSAPA